MTVHWSFFKLMFLLSVGCLSAERCDRASAVQEREGNLGQSGDFNWLGVLHVRLHELIATSGIVLISYNHALVNADDVARIPQHIFRLHSKAMFLPARNHPWFVKLTSYVAHPEYEFSNLNTIAVIELDLNGVVNFPLTPICLATTKTFDASRYLYLTGFTHENDILEKVIYKIQYLDAKVCEQSYDRSEVSSRRVIPSVNLCGYAPYSATQCVWDNGMTLVSNSFGYLNLVGFGVHGPGCTSPARFIDLFPYFDWINSTTSTTPSRFVPNSSNIRKSLVPNVPIHELYKVASRRQTASVLSHEYEAYPYELYDTQFHLIEPSKDNNTFYISAAQDSWGETKSACATDKKVQMYQEVIELRALENLPGTVTYKLSLYDAHHLKCSCVRLTVSIYQSDIHSNYVEVDFQCFKMQQNINILYGATAYLIFTNWVICTKRSDFIIKFKEKINFKEDTDMNGTLGDGTPEELFRYYLNPNHKESEDDLKFFRPSFVDDQDVLSRRGLTYDLYITFEFTERGKLKFEMFAPLYTTTTSTKSTTTTTSTSLATSTEKPKVLRKARTKVKAKQKSRWGVNNWADMLREAEVSVADVEEVYGMESAARGERMPVTTVIAGCLIGVGLRALYIR